MPEMSGKFKLNPTKTNNLIYIMIFFQGGKKILRGVKKKFATLKKFTPPLPTKPLFTPLSVNHVLLPSLYFDVPIRAIGVPCHPFHPTRRLRGHFYHSNLNKKENSNLSRITGRTLGPRISFIYSFDSTHCDSKVANYCAKIYKHFANHTSFKRTLMVMKCTCLGLQKIYMTRWTRVNLNSNQTGLKVTRGK